MTSKIRALLPRIILFGESETGKSTFFYKVIQNCVPSSYYKTIETNSIYVEEGKIFDLFDTSSEAMKNAELFQNYLNNADGVVLFYSLDRSGSMRIVENNYEIAKKNGIPVMILENETTIDIPFKSEILHDSPAIITVNDEIADDLKNGKCKIIVRRINAREDDRDYLKTLLYDFLKIVKENMTDKNGNCQKNMTSVFKRKSTGRCKFCF